MEYHFRPYNRKAIGEVNKDTKAGNVGYSGHKNKCIVQ